MSDVVLCVYMYICIYTLKPDQTKPKKKPVSPNGYKYLKKEDKTLRESTHSQR